MNDVLRFFAALDDHKSVCFKKDGVVAYLVVTASDAMAIKPGLQFSQQVNGVIGLKEPTILSSEIVKQLISTKSDVEIANHLKDCTFKVAQGYLNRVKTTFTTWRFGSKKYFDLSQILHNE